MKILGILTFTLVICIGTPAFATPSIEFSPNPDTAGNWNYDGAGTLGFDQVISVDRAMGSNADPLVNASVFIPTLSVSGTPYGPYTLKPLSRTTILIGSSDGSAIYLKGTLGKGDLVPVGTIGAGYTCFTSDITDVVVTSAGKSLGSAALNAIINSGITSLDFELSLQGGSGTNYHSLTQMLTGGYSGGNGFSGAMTIPEPATIALLCFGSLTLLRKRIR